MNPIKRKILIVVLGLGTVLGYAGGFASMRRSCGARRGGFERHVARLCADAALNPTRAPADEPWRDW